MSIVIIGDSFTFPEGTAATNHAYTYAKGFIEHGVKVFIVCTRNEYLENYNGCSDGVTYYHPFGRKQRSSLFIARRWHAFTKYYKTFSLLRKINKQEKIIVLNLWTYRLITQIFVFMLSKYFKTKFILERSEHPSRLYKNNWYFRIIEKARLAFERQLYDGIFCISDYIIDFYKDAGYDPGKLFLVPSTVDITRFNKKYDPPLNYDYMAYCGSLTILKDGVDILVRSFARISGRFPGLKLVLIGQGDTIEEEIIIRRLVEELNMKDNIILLGRLPRATVPAYLTNAKMLLLARPKSKIADAGFPSKLTEYLSTGNPVVVTKVGEIPFYLKNNITAFLAEPDNIDSFAERIIYALDNYELALEIGSNGKELTKTTFNYNYQAKRMLEFIDHL